MGGVVDFSIVPYFTARPSMFSLPFLSSFTQHIPCNNKKETEAIGATFKKSKNKHSFYFILVLPSRESNKLEATPAHISKHKERWRSGTEERSGVRKPKV